MTKKISKIKQFYYKINLKSFKLNLRGKRDLYGTKCVAYIFRQDTGHNVEIRDNPV